LLNLQGGSGLPEGGEGVSSAPLEKGGEREREEEDYAASVGSDLAFAPHRGKKKRG